MLDLLLSTIGNLIYNLSKIKSQRLTCPQRNGTEENVFQIMSAPCNYQVQDLV